MKQPLTAKLRVQIELSDGSWIEMSRHTMNENTITDANFNTDDLIDETIMKQAMIILEEAIL